MKIAIKLKQIMKDKGITQMQLSEMANVRQAAISELCRNARTEINLDMLCRIAEALEIKDISQLLQIEE